MAEKRSTKVEGKQLGRKAEADATPIDLSILEMLKGLELPEYGSDFSERIAAFTAKIGANIKALRSTLQQKNFRALETVACELSSNALMIGAVQILSSSYELQNAARCGDLTVAHSIADQLELEFHWAQEGLKEAVGQV